MRIKNLIDEDFANYKKPSLFIGCGECDFKCDRECGKAVCQNSALAKAPSISVYEGEIIDRFFNNPITEAFVFGGLEPFYSQETVDGLIHLMLEIIAQHGFRHYAEPIDVVIYTGFYPDEVYDYLKEIQKNIGTVYNGKGINVIIKFGRFIPDDEPRFDNLLGVELASSNQYAMELADAIEGAETRIKLNEWAKRRVEHLNKKKVKENFDNEWYKSFGEQKDV